MKRLTIRNSDGSVSQPLYTTVADAFFRLAAYEDTGLEPEVIEAAVNGQMTLQKALEEKERVVVQLRKQWQEATQFICMHCKNFDWEEVNGLICGTKTCGCITGVPFCDDFVSRKALELDAFTKADREGRLVVLPCKVGDWVYALWNVPTDYKYVIYCAEVKEIRHSVKNCRLTTTYILEPIEYRGRRKEYRDEDFGKTVFLTQEEAEKAMEGANING